ncbi:MAG: hypothetical protein M1823_006827, partial [Watsoniomyces obsoletus]
MAFERHARQDPDLTLMAHINYLTQHVHTMATETSIRSPQPDPSAKETENQIAASELRTTLEHQVEGEVVDADRPHIRFIPRPPEWDYPQYDSDEDSSGFDDGEEYTGSEDGNDETPGGASLSGPTTAALVSGNSIVISFPGIELFSIELLEMVSLALTLKCDRCKSTVDIKNLRSSPSDSSSLVTLTESCPKCAATLAASYHAEPMHANSIKAGHLDLTSCT